MVIGWPNRGSVVLKSIKLGYNATAAMLGYGDGNLTMKQINDSVWIKFPEQNKVKSQWVYTIKLLNVYH